MNIARIRPVYFQGLSMALFETDRRYGGRAPESEQLVEQIYREQVDAVAAPFKATISVPRIAEAAQDHEPTRPVASADLSAAPSTGPIDDRIERIADDLISVRKEDKTWDDDAQSDARNIFQLTRRFLAQEFNILGLAQIRQSNMADYVRLIRNDIYKHYGKSPRDETRTIDELRKIAAQKPQALRGLEGTTVNKHLTFIGQLLRFARSQGIKIDNEMDLTSLRVPKPKNQRARNQRPVPPAAALVRVFKAPCFHGCASWDKPYDVGQEIYHRGLYYVPTMLVYWEVRREEACGLEVDDFFLDGPHPYVYIRPNGQRRVKNVQSIRYLPLHFEQIRLNLPDYVKAIRRLGYKRVFPDLYSPSSQSPLGDRFYDEVKPVLTTAKITEEELNLVPHAIRHRFNDAVKQLRVHEEERADLMGHGGASETSERYCDPIELSLALKLIQKLPCVTEGLVPHPIRLVPWVEEVKNAPWSRPSRAKFKLR